MSYAEQLTSMSRTPVTLVVMTLDYCGRTFGVSPCLATGTPCYNTLGTCKYKSAYLKTSKDYKFTPVDTPLPFKNGERPYLQGIKYLPTEIKDNLTVNARVTLTLLDEPDNDIGIDPYLSQRASTQGTFWRKLLARNPHYNKRTIRIAEGFLGLSEAEFANKFIGAIHNIRLGRGKVSIEVVDLLKSLASVDIPAKISCKVISDVNTTTTAITVSNAAELDDPANGTKYVRIDDEIISYTSRNLSTNVISGGARAQFGTVAVEHQSGAKVTKVKYYAPQNPYDILLSILAEAGIDNNYIDTPAFMALKTYPIIDINRRAIIVEPTKADKLFFELINELDCKCWVNEDLKITIAKNIQNLPGRTYMEITDEANIVNDSTSVDLNDKSRLTRIVVYWDKRALGSVNDVNSYNRIDIVIDADAEGANEYGEIIEKKIYSRWLDITCDTEENLASYIRANYSRQLFRQRDAQMLLDMSVELKDQDIRTGDYVKVTTNTVQEMDGKPLTRRTFQIIRREQAKVNEIKLRAIAMPKKKVAFIAPAGTPTYTSATEAQREYGFLSNARGVMSNDDDGYRIY